MSCRHSVGMHLVRFLVAMLLIGVVIGEAQAAAPTIKRHPVYEARFDPSLDPGQNLFYKAAGTDSGHEGYAEPRLAVDGTYDDPYSYWDCRKTPAWLRIELAEKKDLNMIRVWTRWGEGRKYQYVVEGSADGKSWVTLVDRRQNASAATRMGETYPFPTVSVRYVRITFPREASGNGSGAQIVEMEGYAVKPAVAKRMAWLDRAWAKAPGGLLGAWGSVDVRYPRDEVPALKAASTTWKAAAWRGERRSAQLVLWTRTGAEQVRLACTALRNEEGDEIPAACLRSAFVRYVLGDGQLLSDPLDQAPQVDLWAHSVRPVWLWLDVPAGAKPGLYQGQLSVKAKGDVALGFPIQVEVLPGILPPPAQWTFWLDLWQNPHALARYHHVTPWSPEHFAVMEPHLKMLANAGQKCITTSIIHQPWGPQTFDPYDSMVQWIRRADGRWTYDYAVFDQYVEFAMRCGITGAINCYSMVPWTNAFRYFDQAKGEYVTVVAQPGTRAYEELWRPFLKDFSEHLGQKGWLGKTAIAMDERPPELMKPMIAFVRKEAPRLKIALAGAHHPELKNDIDDWCVYIDPALDPAIARERTSRGLPTTFYVCCSPERPSVHTFSPPAEAAWMGWYAAAQGYSGFLFWAYDSWTDDPLLDTSYVTWPAGDCFLVYPGPRSSIRFERLREGIQDYEKIRLVRAELQKGSDAEAVDHLKRLEDALKGFSYGAAQKAPAAQTVGDAQEALLNAFRLMKD